MLDFGLARATREEKADGALTSEGQAIGTPDFIAPEQILDAPNADIRADIYSLGGSLFYLLAGRPPFLANSVHAVYEGHISGDPGLLNHIRPEVPVELAAVVAKMMAKKPDRRFQTPGDVADALMPFFEKRSVRFKGPSAEVAGATPSSEGLAESKAVSSLGQPATDPDLAAMQAQQSAEPTIAEVRWDSLIEFRDSASVFEEMPSVTPAVKPWWLWPSVGVGVLMVGLFAVWRGSGSSIGPKPDAIALINVPRPSDAPVIPSVRKSPGKPDNEGQPHPHGGSKSVEVIPGIDESEQPPVSIPDEGLNKQAEGDNGGKERETGELSNGPTAGGNNQKAPPVVTGAGGDVKSLKLQKGNFRPLFDGSRIIGLGRVDNNWSIWANGVVRSAPRRPHHATPPFYLGRRLGTDQEPLARSAGPTRQGRQGQPPIH